MPKRKRCRISNLRLLSARAAIVGLTILTLAHSAYGHAIVVASQPSVNQSVKGPDVPVKIRFNSRIDAKRSRVVLVLPGGSEKDLVLGDKSGPDTLDSEAAGLAPGSYSLRWQVLASDGHITRGEVPFRVQ